jgi:hypothetical protein
MIDSHTDVIAPVPSVLRSRNPLNWVVVFGPGAIIASLTIGTGELIFSTRGGALFGYPVLFLFVVISVLKWALVFSSARHMVLTGVHPYERMVDLPGPRGWFPLMLFFIVAVCTPVWSCFLSGVTGNLCAWVTGTSDVFGGAIDYLWGAAVLTLCLVLSATCGYTIFERIQMIIVAAMMLCATITLILYGPDWLALIKGAFIPEAYVYPEWLLNSTRPEHIEIAKQPVWVETTRYVGVIGGAGFDYMAYTTWLREKSWGRSAVGPPTPDQIEEIARDRTHPVRQWVRAPLVDCTLSFIVIVGFSAVFIASGVLVLGPEGELPTEKNLLNLQAKLVTAIHPWLLPVYVVGALLTMVGSVYGTIEIACAIGGELLKSLIPGFAERHKQPIRRAIITWCMLIAYALLAWIFWYTLQGGVDKPRILIAILTPVNLFTGVLACGLFCLLLPWIDHKFLPKALRMPFWLLCLNLIAAAVFIALGIMGYWTNHNPDGSWFATRWFTISIILGIVVASILVARMCPVFGRTSDS